MVTDAWVADRFASNVTRAKLKKRALYEILMAQGIEFGRVVQEITAEPANPQLAAWLAVNVGPPLLRVTRVLYAIDRVPVMHITIHASPERSRILMDVPIASMNTLEAGQIARDVPRL
jgi:GntR family transcriptional regulator